MAFLVSPGVQSKEIDASNSVPGVSMSTGAIAGSFNWGPANDIVTVGSEAELVAAFGSPDLTTSSTFLSAANFLMYGRTLRVVRSSRTGALNAASGTAILVENDTAYDAATLSSAGAFIAKHPGALGNAIEVSWCLYWLEQLSR